MIDFFEQFSLNTFSIILLLILLVSMVSKKEIYRYSSRLFVRIIFSILMLLILEILSWSFDGIQNEFAKILNYLFNLVFFVSSGVLAGFFASYVDFLVFKSKERLKRRIYYMHSLIFLLVLGIINMFTPILFTISDSNVYERGPLIILGLGVVGILMVYILIIVYLNKDKVDQKISTIYIFILLPFIAAVLQMMSYGLLIMWSGMALGVVIAYIFTETISTSKDYLTKLYTRAVIDDYVDRLIDKNVSFSITMIDLDDYKLFNDKYGHKEGDKILVYFSKTLLSAFPDDSVVSRFGGDEFVIISYMNEIEVEDCFRRVREVLRNNQEYPLINNAMFSYGYSLNRSGQTQTLDKMLDDADRNMYQMKAVRKNLKRRVTDR